MDNILFININYLNIIYKNNVLNQEYLTKYLITKEKYNNINNKIEEYIKKLIFYLL